jgi:hypothetical protein
VAQSSVIQLQQNCGNQCVQRAVKKSRKNEMMQTKPLGDHVHRQVEEETEEEPIQAKQVIGEIQREHYQFVSKKTRSV